MIDIIKLDSSRSIIPGQAASRGVAGTINFMLINMASQVIRQRRVGMPEDQGDATELLNIDHYNDNIALQEEAEENAANREELGYEAQVDPVERGAVLKLLYQHIYNDMYPFARKTPAESNPNILLPNQFDVPEPVAAVIRRGSEVQPITDRIKLNLQHEADALGVTLEDTMLAFNRRQTRAASFMKLNAAEIRDIIKNLHWTGEPFQDAYQMVDWLEPIVQLRLLAGADGGLFFARSFEIGRYRSNGSQAAANIVLIDGARREVIAEYDRLMRIESFKRSVENAQSKGANLPFFNPPPPAVKNASVRKQA